VGRALRRSMTNQAAKPQIVPAFGRYGDLRRGERRGRLFRYFWDVVTICDHIVGRVLEVVTICDRMLSNSFLEIRKAKSSGKRDAFRRMAWFNAFVVTP
jgi:hypothetical protein